MTKARVAISISESDDLRELGMGTMHLQDALVETARQTLHRGYALAYGGNLNYQGEYNFSQLLNLIARTYSQEKCIYHYVAYPMNLMITKSQERDLEDISEIIPVIPRGDWSRLELTVMKVNYETATDGEKKQIDDALYGIKGEEIRKQALVDMREQMAEETSLRIIMGGKIPQSGNKIPGILAEAFLSLKHNSTVIVNGKFGGASRLIINAVANNEIDNHYFSLLSDIKDLAKDWNMAGDVLFIKGKQDYKDFITIGSWA